MSHTNRKLSPAERYAGHDRTRLERDLDTAEANIRELRRRVHKLEEQLDQTRRAYDKTVANMLEIIRENLQLTHECERLRFAVEMPFESVYNPGFPSLSDEEISAIRKAMARLHHPDVGGNAQRMQYWNAFLDRIERQ